METFIAILVCLLILAVFVGLAAYAIWGAASRRRVSISHSEHLQWQPQDSAVHVVAGVTPLMQSWGYRIQSQGPVAVVFANSYRPVWLIIPCILLFPFGLLALLYSARVEVTFNFPPGSVEGTDLTVLGEGPPTLRDQLPARLEELQRPAT